MDLLLTHGYFLDEDPKELQIMKPYAPLGLLYLSSYLRARGFAVEIYDSTFGSRAALYRILETERPATLGVYANLMTRGNDGAFGLVAHLRPDFFDLIGIRSVPQARLPGSRPAAGIKLLLRKSFRQILIEGQSVDSLARFVERIGSGRLVFLRSASGQAQSARQRLAPAIHLRIIVPLSRTEWSLACLQPRLINLLATAKNLHGLPC